jgi:chromosome segregation ATPase
MTALQTSFKAQRGKLNGRIQALISTNTTLELQITTSQTQSEGLLLLRDNRIALLEEQNKKMKEEMAKLIARQAEENKRMQEQIDAAVKEKQEAYSAGVAIWLKTQDTLCARIQSLQSQLNTLQTNLSTAEKNKTNLNSGIAALNSQLSGLRYTVDSLQKTANNEPARQQAAINAKIAEGKQKILNILDRNIQSYDGVGGPSWQDGKFYHRESTGWALKNSRNVVIRFLP